MAIKKVDKNEKKKIVYSLSLVTQMGLSMIVPIFMCMFVGIWLSKYIDSPVVVLFSIFFGLAVAFRNAYVLVCKMFMKDKEKEDAEYEYYKSMEEERIKRLGK